MNPDEIFHRLEQAGNDYADKEAAASLLEETKNTMLSECMSDWPEDSNAGAETKARRDPRYKEHLEKMVEARRQANRAKVKYFSVQAWIELKRTQEATERVKVQKGL